MRQGNRPKDYRIQHSWDRETRPKDHIWAMTIYGIETGLKDHIWDSTQLGQGNRTQRPYMGFNTVRQGNRPKDHRIQHSWDREARPKDHIWAKTIYGQRPYMGLKPDSKTIYGIQHSETGKPTQRS